MSGSYETFVNVCKHGVKYGGSTVGTLDAVNLKKNTCILRVDDNETELPIGTIVQNVLFDGMGVVTNPSLLRKWRGWKMLDNK